MEEALVLLNSAVESGEAEGWCLAYVQDRVLVMSGKPQVYGTQHDIDGNGMAYPFPTAEPERVDALRTEVGLEPLREATKRIQERHNFALGKGK